MIALLTAMLVLAPDTSVSLEDQGSRSANDSTTIEASVQFGLGRSSENLVLLRPRFHFQGDPSFALTLGAPVLLGGEDSPFETSEDWASWVEKLHLDLDGVRLDVGPLVEFGDSLTIVDLTSRLGPVELRNGLIGAWEGDRAQLRVFSDGLLDPRVIGTEGRYRWIPGDTALDLDFSAAFDPRAPTRLGDMAVGAGDLTLRLGQRLGDGVLLIAHAASGVLLRNRPASVGAASGLGLEIGGEDARMTLTGELRWAGRDYIVGYFDRVYAIEREGVGEIAKADLSQDSGAIARGGVAFESRRFAVALSGERGAIPGRARFDLRVEAFGSDWQLRGLLVQRAVDQVGDVVELETTSVATLDGSLRVWGSFFAFGAASHRVEDGERVREVFAGIGVGQRFD